LSIAEQRAVGFIPAWSLAFLQQGFKLQKLERLLVVKNINRTYNSREAICQES